MRTKAKRIEALDGLRGIASLIVLVHHSFLVIPDLAKPFYNERSTSYQWLVYTPAHTIWAGTEAVFVFFILSGIVLTLPVLQQRSFSWRAYYPSRLVRLYLPVLASLVLALAFSFLVPRENVPGGSIWLNKHSEPVTILTFFNDALLINGTSRLNSPLWSLRWEVVFSILLPVYVFVALRVRRAAWPLALIAIATVAVSDITNITVGVYLPMFAVGVLAAARWADVEHAAAALSRSRLSGVLWLATTSVSLLLLTGRWTFNDFFPLPGGIWNAIALVASCGLIFAAVGWSRAERALKRPTVQWLATVSFSLYLIHEPVVVTVANLLPADAAWWTPVICIPTSLVLSHLFYRGVERPSHILAQKIKRSLSPAFPRSRDKGQPVALSYE